MILLHYSLSKDLWRRFFEVHYAADPTLKTRYLWGVICIVSGALGFGGFYHSPLIAALLLATGFYGVLSRQLLVIKSLRGAVRHPFYGQTLSVGLNREQISVRSGEAGYDQPWSNFIGYRESKTGFMFYHDKVSFFFIPSEALSSRQTTELRQLLTDCGLTRL